MGGGFFLGLYPNAYHEAFLQNAHIYTSCRLHSLTDSFTPHSLFRNLVHLTAEMNWKKYLPTLEYTLATPLTVGEVQKRMMENLEAKRNFPFVSMSMSFKEKYEGSVWSDGFAFTRVVNGKNFFIPETIGLIKADSNKTVINVKMRLQTFTRIIMTFGLVFVGSFFLLALILGIRILSSGHHIPNNSIFFIVPFFMFIFGYGIVTAFFQSECQQTKKFLKKLLEGQEDLHNNQ
jgi:hypothetical protein